MASPVIIMDVCTSRSNTCNGMLGAVTRVNQPLAVTSAGNQLQDLIIWKDTSVPALVIALQLLMFQLLLLL